MNRSQGVFLIFLLSLTGFCQAFKRHDYLVESSFLSENVLSDADEMSDAILAELDMFNNKVMEKLADRVVTVLDNHGFDLNSRKNVEALFNFLELVDPEAEPQKKPGFWRRIGGTLKKAAVGLGKQAVVHATKAMFRLGIKEALPYLETFTKNSLNGLPVKLRLAVAPLLYKLWLGLFAKAGVKPPPDFTLKNMMTDGLTEEGMAIYERGQRYASESEI